MNRTRSHATIGLLIAAGADRRFLADALRQAGNGVAILDAACAPDDLDIDLVIVDEAWIRGEFDALVGWKTAQRPHYLPFLALLPQRSNTNGLLRVGFDDVLRSPIANDELLARVETFLRLRRHAQETHASNEARFRATLDRVPAGIAHCLSDGRFVRVNRRLCEIFGMSETSLMALRLQQLVPLDLAGSVTQEVHHRRPGGPATWLQVTLSFVFDEATARQYVVAIFEDINERKRAASALREARDRLASIVSSSPMPIWTLDATGVFTTMNAAAREIFGMRFVDSSRPLPIAATDEVQRALLARVLSGETIRDHEMNFSRNDGRVAYLAVSQTPLRDAEGAITGVLAVAADISERKSAAETLRMMNADLERRVAERTADLQAANREMEAFTYSVSHDLRAPVRAIEGFTNLLISDHGAPMEGAAGNLMLRVRGAAQRMERLIDGLLALSRTSRQRMHAERTDLSALARDVVAELREQAPQREVQVTIEDGLQVDGDSRFLRQALENLLGNAWKYTSMNASAHIEFGARGDGAGALEYFVRDDGAGFDMRYAAKLFTPFERLHSESEFPGVGVGLATVQRVIARHGGTIRGEGAPGAGAAFYFTLGRVAD